MQLENKKFMLEKKCGLAVEIIEKFILNNGYKPLRWAVVKVDENYFTVEASCIKTQ